MTVSKLPGLLYLQSINVSVEKDEKDDKDDWKSMYRLSLFSTIANLFQRKKKSARASATLFNLSSIILIQLLIEKEETDRKYKEEQEKKSEDPRSLRS